MFKTSAQAREFFGELITLTQFKNDREVAFGVPAITLEASAAAAKATPIIIAAQNLYWESEGAFTGEISAPMIAATGASAVIIGHSERRQMFGDTGEWVNKKIKAALAAKLMPIVCIGESLAEREGGQTFTLLSTQLKEAFDAFTPADMATVVIAYEPVWAIGTGKTATPEMAEEVHAHIRKWLTDRFDKTVAGNTRILYGGSVKPDNVAQLMVQPDIDGALVGGASLKAADFAKIINFDA
jgi:triosephosphate isomerase